MQVSLLRMIMIFSGYRHICILNLHLFSIPGLARFNRRFQGIVKYKPDCLFDTCNIFCKLFFAFDVALSLDHDPLCLWRACSMHGFCSVSYCGCS